MNESHISVPVPTEVFVGLIEHLREVGSDRDPVETVTDAIRYLIDSDHWRQEGLMPEISESSPAMDGGFGWKDVFLPHGTHVRMKYKREYFYARVDGDKFLYRGEPVSPSQFANKVANSYRNAWRDLWIMKPGSEKWVRADDLRLVAGIEGL